MFRRSLHRARAAAQEPGRWLGSWRLSIALMVSAALYAAFLAVWATSSPPHVVANIAGLAPFWLVYGLLLVNTGVCLWNRLPALRRRLAREPRFTGREPDWRLAAGDGPGPQSMRRSLRRAGFRTRIEEERRVVAVRRRWAPLGTYLFHAAFFLVAAGFLLSMAARREATVWVAVGEEFTGRPDQVLSRSAPRLLAAGAVPRDLAFRLTDLRPEFWGDQLLFTGLAADLELADGVATTRINRPLWIGWSSFLRLSGFGYVPRYELRDRQGRVLDSAFVKMNLFPPGQNDYFRVEGYPHRFRLEILPDVSFEDGRAVNRSLNLRRPGVLVEVSRGKLVLAEELLVDGADLEFEGLRISFPEIRTWGELSVVRDPGVVVLFLGYLLGLAGLTVRVAGRRGEIEWRRVEGAAELRGWGCRPPRRLAAAFEAAEADGGDGTGGDR